MGEGWHFFATNLDRAGGEVLAINDLELAGSQITTALSGPGGITGTIPVEQARLKGADGLPLLRPWRSCVYAELDGVIRGGGVIADDIDIDDPAVRLSCKGLSAYPTGQPYKGDKWWAMADPFDIAREFWSDLQGWPRGNIGLDVVFSPASTPIRLGKQPVDKWTIIDQKAYANKRVPLLPPGRPFQYVYYDTDSAGHTKKVTRYGMASRSQYFTNDPFPQMWWDTGAFTTSRGKLLFWSNGELQEQEVYPKAQSPFPGGLVDGVIRDSNGNITFAIFGYFTSTKPTADADGEELQPYRINEYDTLDMGQWWDNLCKDGGFDYYETHAWAPAADRNPRTGEPVNIDHVLHVGYPTVGRNLRTSPSHRFEIGINVSTVPTVALSADDYCDEVLVVGAGEGPAKVRGRASVPDQGRMHRTRVVSDPMIKTNELAQKRAAQEASSYAGDHNVSELKVRNHSFAPLGSYGPGDTLQLLGSGKGWADDLNQPFRITQIAVTPDEGDTATLTGARPDKVSSEV